MKKNQALSCASLIVVLCLVHPAVVHSQDSSSLYQKAFNLPDKFFGAVNNKSEKLQEQLARSTEKYLNKLKRREHKLYRQLAKKDSTAAKEAFGDIDKRYDSMLQAGTASTNSVYSGHLDSMKTTLSFLQQNKSLSQSSGMQAKLKSVFKDYSAVQQSLNKTDFIQKQIKERQQYLKDKLKNFGMAKQLQKFQEKVYYYRAQVEEYKNVFENPKKLESTLLQAANKIPAFQQFFNKHSQLASLFRLPGNDDLAMVGAEGLQTRGMISEELGQRMGSAANMQQNMANSMADAQSGLDKAKNRINQLGTANGDMDMPNFKPNDQKTKSFLNRLELGTNIQSTKGSSFFPVTSDLGLSIGYKLSPKAVIGVGTSYKVGLGQSIRKVKVTSEGIGLRSFADMKIKGSFYVTGGLEYNYQQPFVSLQVLDTLSSWRKSGLIGISKIISLKGRLMKKTKMQLLWDFLSINKVPQTQPIIFRVNYSLK